MPPSPVPYSRRRPCSRQPNRHGLRVRRQGQKKKTALIVGIIIAVLVVALAAGFGVWWFMLRDSGTQSAQTQSTSQQSGKTKSGDSKAAKDDKPCTAAPDAELSSVDHSDTNLVAQLQLTSNCASTKDGDTAEFKESDVKVSIKDDEGNVIASAVFDFSKQPVKFNGETANVALGIHHEAVLAPVRPDRDRQRRVILQTGQSGTGEAGSADGDALAGSDINSEDAERYAQLALSWQLKHDESAASRFYTTYTTQLSSKKNGMKADGKGLALRGHLRAVPAAAHQAQERDPDLVRRLPDVHEGRRFDRVLRDPVG